jgi:hypothetical protein
MICPKCGLQRGLHGSILGGCNCSFVTPVSPPIEFISGPIPVSPILPPTAANMTLRDYFAAKAMQGMLACPAQPQSGPDMYARDAYAIADAMLKAREK